MGSSSTSRWGPIGAADEALVLNLAARTLDNAEEDKALRGCSTAVLVRPQHTHGRIAQGPEGVSSQQKP